MAHRVAKRYRTRALVADEFVIECSCGWTEKAYTEQLVDARFVRHREGK